MSESCVYEGWVRHRRFGEPARTLRHRLFMTYLDLDELPGVLDGRFAWSSSRPALARYKRRDHLGDPQRPLADEVRDLVAARTGRRPNGPVRMLAHLRYLGYCFNPVSFFYCYDERGALTAVVAEVTNTPWGERHAYVLGGDLQGRFSKELHVSPFMGMQNTYAWQMTEPGERLTVEIASEGPDGERIFDATLSMLRKPISAAVLLRHPLMTQRMSAAIYMHGLKLKLAGARYFPNPTGTPPLGATRRRRARHSREEVSSS
ncbi:MAG: DUF1365 domain-containing protein [Solirubrobacteraceae bacterium]